MQPRPGLLLQQGPTTETAQPSGAQASWISKSLFLNHKHIFRHEIGFLRFEHGYTLPLIEGTHCKLIRRWLYKMDGRNPESFFHVLVLVHPPKLALWNETIAGHSRWSLMSAQESVSFSTKTPVQGSFCCLKQNTFSKTSFAQNKILGMGISAPGCIYQANHSNYN